MLWSKFGARVGTGVLSFLCLEWEWGYRGHWALGREGPGSRQSGLVRSQGFICLTLMNKWHPQPLFIYFWILTNNLWHLMERVISCTETDGWGWGDWLFITVAPEVAAFLSCPSLHMNANTFSTPPPPAFCGPVKRPKKDPVLEEDRMAYE